MTARTEEVLSEALDLSPVERAELVEQILASFDFPSREETDALWAAESEDRIDAYNQGKIKATPAHKVLEKIDG